MTHLPVLTRELFSLPRNRQVHPSALGAQADTWGLHAAPGEAQHKAGLQPGISSTSEHNRAIGKDFPSQELLSFVLIQREKNPFEGCASHLLALPQLALRCCSFVSAGCSLPGRVLCTLMGRNIQSLVKLSAGEPPAPGNTQCRAGQGAVAEDRLRPRISQGTAHCTAPLRAHPVLTWETWGCAGLTHKQGQLTPPHGCDASEPPQDKGMLPQSYPATCTPFREKKNDEKALAC